MSRDGVTALTETAAGSSVGGQAFSRVLETIGRAIVSGELPPGHVDTVEGLGRRTGASRSIVREAMRVLVSLGLVSAGRRVGLTVLGRDRWDVLDPAVIRWRLDSPDRERQVDELRALRLAIEPEAARSGDAMFVRLLSVIDAALAAAPPES